MLCLWAEFVGDGVDVFGGVVTGRVEQKAADVGK